VLFVVDGAFGRIEPPVGFGVCPGVAAWYRADCVKECRSSDPVGLLPALTSADREAFLSTAISLMSEPRDSSRRLAAAPDEVASAIA
jgi:hypothetical protein